MTRSSTLINDLSKLVDLLERFMQDKDFGDTEWDDFLKLALPIKELNTGRMKLPK